MFLINVLLVVGCLCGALLRQCVPRAASDHFMICCCSHLHQFCCLHVLAVAEHCLMGHEFVAKHIFLGKFAGIVFSSSLN